MNQSIATSAMTKRPMVQLQTPNQANALRSHRRSTLPLRQTVPGLVGITLNGGLSCGYGDHLSEIDVTLYLAPEMFAQ